MELKKLFRAGNSTVVALGFESKLWLNVVEGDRVIIQNSPGPVLIIKKAEDRLRKIIEEPGDNNG